jgi:hypothetical protein
MTEMDEQTINAEKAQQVADLKASLAEKVVIFTYTKKDGTQRVACGTLKPDLLPNKLAKFIPELIAMVGRGAVGDAAAQDCDALLERVNPTSAKFKKPEMTGWVNYYDLGAADWRKFHTNDFESVSATY